jgi:hypothetical protein
MSESTQTPQINVSKIPGGAGIAGALFALGTMMIFLVGVPRIRVFFVGAIIVGIGVALVLRFIRHETPGKSWILPATEEGPGGAPAGQVARTPSSRPEDLPRNLQALAPV